MGPVVCSHVRMCPFFIIPNGLLKRARVRCRYVSNIVLFNQYKKQKNVIWVFIMRIPQLFIPIGYGYLWYLCF